MRSLHWLMIILLILTACNQTDPDGALGPVIEQAQIVSSATYKFDDTGFSDRDVFVRYVHYFARPNQFTILSSGDTAPVTLFEDASVYILSVLGGQPNVIRVFSVPNVQTSGIEPLRLHLAMRSLGPPLPSGDSISNAIVYFEDGPIYGGFIVGGSLDPQFTGDQPPRLLVNAKVRKAALASDGKTIAYVDITGWLFVVTPGEGSPIPVIDLRNEFGPVSVRAIQWDQDEFDRVILRIDRGIQQQTWSTSTTQPQLMRIFGNAASVQEPGSDLVESITESTSMLGPGEWDIPAPGSFTP